MKEIVQQKDLYRTHYVAVFLRGTSVVARGSTRQIGTRPHVHSSAVSRFSQCIIITPFLETT